MKPDDTKEKMVRLFLDMVPPLFRFGIFQHPVRVAGNVRFSDAPSVRGFRRKQVFLPPFVRQKPTFNAHPEDKTGPKQTHTGMDGVKEIQIRLSAVLSGDVRKYCLPNVESVRRRKRPSGGNVVLDVPPALGLGVYGRKFARMGRAVRFRILQPDADLRPDRFDFDGSVQAPQLVRFLPYGNDDANHLQAETRKRNCESAKIRIKKPPRFSATGTLKQSDRYCFSKTLFGCWQIGQT